MEPETLISDESPNGNLQAFVEQDDRAVHFYLWGGPGSEFGTRSCWVRNLLPAPHDQNQTVVDMRAGIPPMLARSLCRHPDGAEPLTASRLRIVWFEEGDAAALLDEEELLAVIPGWSGQDGFSGYARDCLDISPLCWPLSGAQEQMKSRIARAEEFWSAWTGENSPWPTLQDQMITAYGTMGPYSKYYAIDGGRWPPKALLRIPLPSGGVALVTLGMSLRPQPCVEKVFENPSLHRRIELGISLGRTCSTDEDVMRMGRYLSAQSGLPWANFTWLGSGHTIPCDSVPEGMESGFSSVLLHPTPQDTPDLCMPSFRGDPISVLWHIPISDAELAFAKQEGGGRLAE